jgi:hypothetical protein
MIDHDIARRVVELRWPDDDFSHAVIPPETWVEAHDELIVSLYRELAAT